MKPDFSKVAQGAHELGRDVVCAGICVAMGYVALQLAKQGQESTLRYFEDDTFSELVAAMTSAGSSALFAAGALFVQGFISRESDHS